MQHRRLGHLLLHLPRRLHRLQRLMGLASSVGGRRASLRQPVSCFSHSLARFSGSDGYSRSFSGITLLLFISFAAFYGWRVIRFSLGVRKLWEMHEFYTELLEVPEVNILVHLRPLISYLTYFALQNDIQTIPWHAIVARVSALRATHPSALSSRSSSTGHGEGARLDAHDVANRIMREENYLISLFNKDVLDLSIPVPAFVERVLPRAVGMGSSMLTQTLEWNLSFCLVGFLFGRDGQVRRAFLMERNKKELVDA